MKRVNYLVLLFVCVFVASCGGKSGTHNGNEQQVLTESTDAQGLQRMQASKSETSITFKGKKYQASISRTPDDQLSLVSNEMGEKFVDNKVVLNLTREGSQVLQVTLTKNSFAPYVSADFLSKSILEGVVYNKTTPAGIVFAASICYPQSDMYIPLSITVSADGKMRIEKVDILEEAYDTESV